MPLSAASHVQLAVRGSRYEGRRRGFGVQTVHNTHVETGMLPSCTPAEHARAPDPSLGTACYPMGLSSNHSGLPEALGLIPHTPSPQFRVHAGYWA